MPSWDASTARVEVFTFKEGLLGAMAHDLKLEVGRFRIEQEGDALTATFEAASLRLVAPRKDGHDAPGLLPRLVYAEIEKNARDDALQARKHPQIRFAGTLAGEREVVGTLTLAGKSREVRCARADEADFHLARAWVDVRDFGLKPYTAMLGTLRVQPRVEVVVRIPREAAPG